MKKLVLKTAVFICLVTLVLGAFPLSAGAARSLDEVRDEIAKKQEYIDQLAAKIEANQDNKEQAETWLQEYQVEYENLVALIDEQEVLIDDTANQLDIKGQELSDTIVSIQENKEMYSQRLLAIYEMNGSNAFMAMVLNVNSFSDAMATADALQRISQHDVDLLQQLADQQEQYELQKVELEETIANLQAEMERLETDKANCQASMDQMNSVIANANYNIKLSQQETEATEEDIEKLKAELAAIFAEQQKKGSQAGDDTVRYDGPMAWPVPGYGKVTSYFGDPRSNTGYHYGIDIPAPTGTAVVAAASGTVITATWHYSYGYYIVIDHGQGLRTLYAHCAELWAGVGSSVSAGDAIAGVGNTGDSYGSHLHFEVHEHGTRQNPLGAGYLSY